MIRHPVRLLAFGLLLLQLGAGVEAQSSMNALNETDAGSLANETDVTIPDLIEDPMDEVEDEAMEDSTEEVLRMDFRFRFFDGTPAPPASGISQEEIEGVVCQSQGFVTKVAQDVTGDDSLHYKATEINWEYDEDEELPVHVSFTAELLDSDGNLVEDFPIEELEMANFQDFIIDWVWKSEPKEESIFFEVQEVKFDAEMTSPVEGQLKEVDCPEVGPMLDTDEGSPDVDEFVETSEDSTDGPPEGSADESSSADMTSEEDTEPYLGDDAVFRLNYRFGFFDEIPQSDIADLTLAEIEGVMCQTQAFITHVVQNATGDDSLHAKVTEIDWTYVKDEDLPVHISFEVELLDDDGSVIDDFPVEELEMADYAAYITDWVWNSEPQGETIFFDVQEVAYDGFPSSPTFEGKLKEIDCPN